MPTLVYRKDGRPNAYVFGSHDAPIVIGRRTDCSVVVHDEEVSREHAQIYTEDDGATWYVRDLKSANGTYINGDRLGENGVLLSDRDVFQVGAMRIEFRRGLDSERTVNPHQERMRQRHTPARPSSIVSDAFEVYDSSESFTGKIPTAAAVETRQLIARIRELEERNRVLERDARRLRELLARTYESPDKSKAPNTGEVAVSSFHGSSSPDTQETEFSRSPMRDLWKSRSMVSAVVEIMDAGRKRPAVLERLSDIVSRSNDHHHDSDDD